MCKILLPKIVLGVALGIFFLSCSTVDTTGGDGVVHLTSFPPSYVHDIQYECVAIDKSLSFDGVEGTIALLNDETGDLSLLDLKTGEKKTLGQTEILNGVSSGDTKLAYIDALYQQVVIVSPQGKKLATIPAPKNWVEILGWVDENILLIGNMPLRENGGWHPPSSTVVLNIVSGAYEEMVPDYPNIYPYTSGPPNFGQYSYAMTAYDPTLTRVVYPGIAETDVFIALWDLPSRRELAHLRLPFSYNPPQWKPDGTSFIVSVPPKYVDQDGNIQNNVPDQPFYVGGNELLRVSRDGKIDRLTYLTTKYNAEESVYTWSPNGEIIAFWLKIDIDQRGWTLATVNVDTGEIKSFCTDGGDGSLPIIWSPDSQKILTTVKNTENSMEELVLVDIQKKTAKVIPAKDTVVGWMESTR